MKYDFKIRAKFVNVLGEETTVYPPQVFKGEGRDYGDCEADVMEQFLTTFASFTENWIDVMAVPVEADGFA